MSKWERVDSSTRRMAVENGWLVETHSDTTPMALAITFVTDPKHCWILIENNPK